MKTTAPVSPSRSRIAKACASWITPAHIVNAVGPFALDPAAADSMPWPTARKTLHRDRGLRQRWDRRGMVWLNPPARQRDVWMRKCANHGNGIALVYARTDTAWFCETVWRHPNTTALLFLTGRVHFAGVTGRQRGPAPAASVLVAYGKNARRRLERAVRDWKLRGRLVILDEAQSSVWQQGRWRKVS
jgi:hypothetical protein